MSPLSSSHTLFWNHSPMTTFSGRTYTFDVSIEIHDAVSFVPGELGTYLAEALFELDKLDLLFPGLKTPQPGERVLSVGLQQTGYQRRPAPAAEATPEIISAIGTTTQRELLSTLTDRAMAVTDFIRDLRLIKAKAEGMRDRLAATPVWTKAQSQEAKALLAALETVTEAHTTQLQPWL